MNKKMVDCDKSLYALFKWNMYYFFSLSLQSFYIYTYTANFT